MKNPVVILLILTAVLIPPPAFAVNQILSLNGDGISIEGTLLMLDDKTPHVAVVVQAVLPSPDGTGEPEVVAIALSDESGKYQLINLDPGNYQVRCYTGKYVYFGRQALTMTGTILQVEQGKTLKNINFRFPPIKKGTWRHYTRLDGLAHNTVNKIHVDPDGFLWLGTDGSGISRFDGKAFVNFTSEDGLPTMSSIYAIHQTPDDVMWFGMFARGVYRDDGQRFVHFGEEVEGLANAIIFAINSDSSGALWFGTYDDGLYRYADEKFDKFTTKEGLAGNIISIIHSAPDGMMWFFTENGASQYDGREFTNLAFEDALVNHTKAFTNLTNEHTMPIHRGPNGELWCAPRATTVETMRTGGFGVFGAVYPEGKRRDGEMYTHITTRDGLPHNRVVSIQSTTDGALWFGIWGGGMSRYDGKGLVNFTPQDGLLSYTVKQLYTDADGVIWVASGSSVDYFGRGGLSRYDPQGFINFTTKDGLPSNAITALHRSPDGALWIGTVNGVSRYNGKDFTSFTTKDGLASNYVNTIQSDRNGILWFGKGDFFIGSEGASRYDTRTGKFLQPLTTQDGLESNKVYTIYTAPDGVVWFGTDAGISRYDTRTGEFLRPFKKAENGLADNNIIGILCDPDGVMWFSSHSSDLTNINITRYDGKKFDQLPAREGFARLIKEFHRDQGKVVWSGSRFGVFQYDGNQLIRFTQKDGLADTQVNAMYPNLNGFAVLAPDEIIWFGTDSSGVCFYDGVAWSSLDTRDGLAGNTVTAIEKDADGSLWFGTQDSGLTRYHRTTSRPKVYITSVTTDKTYRNFDDIPPLITGTRVTIAYNAIDFKTIPEKRQYRYRIREIDEDWLPPTTGTSFDYPFLQPGEYTFEVQAIDRDLNYSAPASLTLKIVPPWYKNGWIAIPSGGGILALLIWSIALSVRVLRQRKQIAEQERQSRKALEAKNEQISELNEQLQDENVRMAAELEITERIQRMILPSADELQSIAELDIAGYMEPADDVGGDYYDVLQREGTVAISIGDVTGHGLESGLVMLMTQTAVQALLHSGETDPVHFLDTLNRTIYNNVQRMDSDKNLTLCLLDYQSGTLKLSGQHEEMIVVRRDGQVELVDTIDLGFPIGLDDNIADFIDQITVQLQPGDGVVLYTDGITEAENTDGEQYGLEQLCKVVSQHWSQSAEAIKEAVIADVRGHIGEQEVYDDITLVVLKQK